MIKKSGIIISFLLLICLSNSYSQDSTRSVLINTHSPRKACYYSAVLPGLGQIYNRKYWKVPIIYAGAIGLIYSIQFSNSYYKEYLGYYNRAYSLDSATKVNYNGPYKNSPQYLLLLKDYYRRNRDLSIICFGLLYAMNIIDAYVDAQLFNFDISDKLTMELNPYLAPSNYGGGGLSLTLRLNEPAKSRYDHLTGIKIKP